MLTSEQFEQRKELDIMFNDIKDAEAKKRKVLLDLLNSKNVSRAELSYHLGDELLKSGIAPQDMEFKYTMFEKACFDFLKEVLGEDEIITSELMQHLIQQVAGTAAAKHPTD